MTLAGIDIFSHANAFASLVSRRVESICGYGSSHAARRLGLSRRGFDILAALHKVAPGSYPPIQMQVAGRLLVDHASAVNASFTAHRSIGAIENMRDGLVQELEEGNARAAADDSDLLRRRPPTNMIPSMDKCQTHIVS